MTNFNIKTEIGYTTPTTITVRGKDLATELMGQVDFVEMMWLVTFGTLPDANQKRMANLILVTACDHGLTPSALSARLTYLGAPEAPQAAIAAGLLGAGRIFLGPTQDCAEMLYEGGKDLTEASGVPDVAGAAERMVLRMKASGKRVYGFGHPIHVDGDPRVPSVRRIARECGYYRKHWKLLDATEGYLLGQGKRKLKLNVVGAIGATVADMGLDPLLARGFMLVGRTGGLLAHLYEEKNAPVGQAVWDCVLAQDPRNIRADK